MATNNCLLAYTIILSVQCTLSKIAYTIKRVWPLSHYETYSQIGTRFPFWDNIPNMDVKTNLGEDVALHRQLDRAQQKGYITLKL